MANRENLFPYVLNALTDLPEGFQQAVQSVLPVGESIQSILMLPSQPYMKRGGIPKQALLSTTHGILQVRDGKHPTGKYLPANALLYVYHKLILLYGHLEVTGEVQGKPVRINVEYNTVGQYLIDAILHQFLRKGYNLVVPEANTQKQNDNILNELGRESFKFMNGLRLYALQPGERLLGYVFQPRIRERFLRFFNRSIAPNALFAITDQAVVFVEEEKARGASYGWVITICPKIVVQTVESQAMQKWYQLSVQLLRNRVNMERNLIFEHESALACEALWDSQSVQKDGIP